ncbi:flavanone 3-dioxygenase 3-like [Diospyros lotus]|uniref:flavanone 3-dioxygenase 3-like n=1 Tax=Diospyros lotus TaxID=55363 RepID=UPI0022522606|nr:flavanone 3-dioxygenase 3-like [Diospyros lotus]
MEGPPIPSSFTSAMTLTRMGDPHLPNRFVLPPSQRPNPSIPAAAAMPVIDISGLHDPAHRPHIIHQVGLACKELGFFQVINHGIPSSLMKDAMDVGAEFFELADEEKKHLVSDDVHHPVRYGTSLNHVKDKVHFWRDFIKHYSHPLSSWIHLWPSNPPTYKEKMGSYAVAVQGLHKQLIGAVFDSLGLRADYLEEDIEQGSQVMAVNFYPACPEPELTLGMPTHSDYGTLTILAQTHQGLQIMDHAKSWHSVPATERALVVQLGDQMEVINNGRYKSVLHRATVNCEKKRLSIASLHSLALEKKVGPAPELVDDKHSSGYKEASFGGFLKHISGNEFTKLGRYVDTLKIDEPP